MPSAKTSNSVLRNLPSVDELLRSDAGRRIAGSAGDNHAASLARAVIGGLRTELAAKGTKDRSKPELIDSAASRLESAWLAEELAGTHRVINATGVVVHTNLGRAPLSDAARAAIADAAGYCTLEYDLETGRRGRRGGRAERLLAELVGAESVLIVNNCAAAAFFVLTVFAAGGEVVISRGELVEIGGDFRVPDVLSQSGAALREVGTTNRTKLADYEKAINNKTRVLLRVHPSNYRIVGFTAAPSVAELAALARKHKVLFYEDIGSGALVDLAGIGLADEPVVSDSLAAGADLVTFSGDKLLGGPQSGIIAGSAAYVEQLRKHPLYRALRVDKLAYAALEATLESYRRGSAAAEVPVQKMLSVVGDEIVERVERVVEQLGKHVNLTVEILSGESAIGGGAAPAVRLATKLVALTHKKKSAQHIELALRRSQPPVITRIVDDKVLLDLRTVSESEGPDLIAAVCALD